MSHELPKSYEPKAIEDSLYRDWEEHGFFQADPTSAKPPYCIVMPPPNVTGMLHMGHALVNTLQDVLIRWKRMSGYEALWVPGTDHAGIATQTIVERHLFKTTGKRRKDFSREQFLKHVWDWKEKCEGQILQQLKKLGCSCDWSRLRFTMDAGNNRAVKVMFKKLYDEKLIYRGDYLVNWDPVTQTALADDEVEYEERLTSLWHFKYPLKDKSGYVKIATTRPETMLGDTAIAVSPNDARYAHLIGKTVLLPLANREIPIIADHHVDPTFGTGMVKVTPAHDPNDYQMSITHNLPKINIMTPDGRINENGGKFRGLTMEEARHAVVKDMDQLGFVEKIEPYVNRVGVSYRSKAIIEPFISKQWFVRMDGFAQKLRTVIVEGKTKIIPQHWESTYFHWIDNLRDWCISRQLWWGHRIPIWYNKKDPTHMICYDGEDLPPEVKKAPEQWQQDEDVLDTWFSSALWPFSTLGWPQNTPELKRFYPNSTLITGHDILFFWVARMIMMGEEAMQQVPFPDTFLHGLIYGKSYWRNNPEGGVTYVSDKERLEYDMGKPLSPDVCFRWEKMSKTKGNVIDPLEIIDHYGADAMRMALCASATQAREIDLDRRRFEEFRNFANKLWNGARFVFLNLEGNAEQGTSALTAQEFSKGLSEDLLTLEDHWIISKLNRTINNVNAKLAGYLFDQAALEAYDFFWKIFCSYYLEIVKPRLFGKEGTAEERTNKQKLLLIILCQAIRLIHPMAPFITEDLFRRLKTRFEGIEETSAQDPYTAECIRALKNESCMVAPFPLVINDDDIDEQIEDDFDFIERAIYTIRNIRGEMKLPPGTATEIHLVGAKDDPKLSQLAVNRLIISALVKTSKLEIHHDAPKIAFASTGIVDTVKILVPLPEQLLEKEITRLAKEREKLNSSIDRARKQVENPDFLRNAPPELIQKQTSQLHQLERELADIISKLNHLEGK